MSAKPEHPSYRMRSLTAGRFEPRYYRTVNGAAKAAKTYAERFQCPTAAIRGTKQ